MKPCRSKKKSIALLSVSALPEAQAHHLWLHVQRCPGCQAYFSQLQQIARLHAAHAAALPEASVSSRFSGALKRQIQDYDSNRVLGWRDRLSEAFMLPRWLWLAGATLILALALIGFWSMPSPTQSTPALASHGSQSPAGAHEARPLAVAPSLARYRQALNQSPEALDALLARESRLVGPRKQSIFTLRDRPSELLARFEVTWPNGGP